MSRPLRPRAALTGENGSGVEVAARSSPVRQVPHGFHHELEAGRGEGHGVADDVSPEISGRSVAASPSVHVQALSLRVVGVHVDAVRASQLQRQGGGGVKRRWFRVQEGSQLPRQCGGGVKLVVSRTGWIGKDRLK
ncbi:hypothetical protein ACP70R_008764 [Stipagrostis hirtigluma subsp. patula]